MVESTADFKENAQDAKLDINSFYLYHEYLAEKVESIEDDQIEANAELVEGEVESLESILTQEEFQKLDLEEKMTENARNQFGNVVQLLNLSVVPNFEGKILVKDNVKN